MRGIEGGVSNNFLSFAGCEGWSEQLQVRLLRSRQKLACAGEEEFEGQRCLLQKQSTN